MLRRHEVAPNRRDPNAVGVPGSGVAAVIAYLAAMADIHGIVAPGFEAVRDPRTCFWGGWGGSLAIIDVDAQMSFSYVMNKMGEGTAGDLRGASLLMAAYGALMS